METFFKLSDVTFLAQLKGTFRKSDYSHVSFSSNLGGTINSEWIDAAFAINRLPVYSPEFQPASRMLEYVSVTCTPVACLILVLGASFWFFVHLYELSFSNTADMWR